MWWSAHRTNLNNAVLVQTKLIRIITCSPLRAHTKSLLMANILISLFNINMYMTCIFEYQCMNGYIPDIFNDPYTSNINMHGRHTRQVVCNGACRCVAIVWAIILAPHPIVRALQLDWWSGTRWCVQWVPGHQSEMWAHVGDPGGDWGDMPHWIEEAIVFMNRLITLSCFYLISFLLTGVTPA